MLIDRSGGSLVLRRESRQREEGQKVTDKSKVPPRYVDPQLRRKFPTNMPPKIRSSAKVK
jgi:hypothetical protein